MLQYLSDSRGIEIYSHQVNLYVQALRERYLRTPENLIYELRLLLRSIAIMSKGYLILLLILTWKLIAILKLWLTSLTLLQMLTITFNW